ncbi:LysM domain-containing protein [Colletotrichum trifolii]|uniref:LysM domain-containing protein n=1 Tax=Colletotrichum trifolii TaxID=5466 RepID=A0A4R8RKG4_COLTR|nr:LysM domain-containing protein [Colletotrichum trifolii]
MKLSFFAVLAAQLSWSVVAQSWVVEPPSTADPATPSDCTWWHTAASSETCDLIAAAYGLPVSDFTSYNPSLVTACKLVTGNSYCLERNWGIPPEVPVTTTTTSAASTPTSNPGNGVATPTPIQDGLTKNCNKFYFVKSGDGCANIASNNGVALADFYSWNPAVGSTCGGLWANVYVCVGIIGGGGGSVTSQPPATTTAPGNGIATPTPIQEGMTATCNKFYFVKSGDGCATIASGNSIALSDFYSWNPAVGNTCGGLWANVYVCVGVIGGGSVPTTTAPSPASTTTAGNGISTPTPIQEGMVGNCNRFYMVKSGDSCASVASANGIALSDFYAWNPAVGGTCAGLWANVYVCVRVVGYTAPATSTTAAPPPTTTTAPGNGISTPTPIQQGMVGNCNKFYKVKSGDGCAAIASSNGVALADLYKWNPAVGNTCASLWLDTYICVGVVGGSTPTTTTLVTTTRAGNGVATPTPIQAGMTNRCKTFHLVVGGDTCYDIAAKAGVTLNNFYAWNPAVGSNCASLWGQYYVCVAVL